MEERRSAGRVIVRRAEADDCERILAWRNEPLTRAMSINQDEISLEQHRAWFGRALANPNLLLLVGSLADGSSHDIGVCRFDLAEDGASAEANINLAAAFHGRGLSTPLLAAGIAFFEQSFPSILQMSAKIRPGNLASRKCFAACGFIEDDAASDLLLLVVLRRIRHFA